MNRFSKGLQPVVTNFYLRLTKLSIDIDTIDNLLGGAQKYYPLPTRPLIFL